MIPGADPGWVGGASEYPPEFEADMRIVLERRRSPGSKSGAPDSFYTAGSNNSDNLFLFIKQRIAGLQPATSYRARFCAIAMVSGVGQYMIAKAGITQREPVSELSEAPGRPYYLMNIDKGVAADGGRDVLILGPLGDFVTEVHGYVRRTVCSSESMSAIADESGALWVLLGADSVFEVLSEAYWMRLEVQLQEE